jgi:prepilin-type N-terminal cleavage/methylation domain-containing protein/prepilin-type processing-associated H-X9-DG protein
MAKTKSGHRAFTLIELLVVISILCLLLAILLPSFMRAKETSRRMVCVSHLSGIGTGVAGYSTDNAGAMVPSGIGWAEVAPAYNNWQTGEIYHSWAQGLGWRAWYWADFIVGYFDSDAHPTSKLDPFCSYASVMAQPQDGNYYASMQDGGCGLVMSKRMNCPDQSCIPPPTWWGAPDGGGATHYKMLAGADSNLGYSGICWTPPNDGKQHAFDVGGNPKPEMFLNATMPRPDSCFNGRPPVFRISNYAMDRLVYIGEPQVEAPNNDEPASLEFYSYAMCLANGQKGTVTAGLPHQLNDDRAGNFMFMDGHVETFTRTYIKNWADNYYTIYFGGTRPNAQGLGPGYPFRP